MSNTSLPGAENSPEEPHRYTVIVSDAADAEIDAAYLRLQNLTSPSFATRWHTGLVLAIEKLSLFPTRHAFAPQSEQLGFDVRRLLFRHGNVAYHVLFTVLDTDGDGETDTVRVIGIRHGASAD